MHRMTRLSGVPALHTVSKQVIEAMRYCQGGALAPRILMYVSLQLTPVCPEQMLTVEL